MAENEQPKTGWHADVAELERRTTLAHGMGGADSIAFHHGRGKLTVRERIELLADDGSFRETGALAGTPSWDGEELTDLKPSNTIIGTCELDGRKVALSGGDFTIRGGAADAAVGNKTRFVEELSLQYRVPYVRLLDATGGSVKTFEQIGRTYLPVNPGGDLATRLLQQVPVVSAVMGSVAGLPAVQACQCHFNLMVKGTSQVFVAGPKVVEQATGKPITKEELGDERVQLKNGVIMNLAEDERDAMRQIRRFLSYLPPNVWTLPPRTECTDDPHRADEELLSIVPQNRRRIYEPREIINAVVDHDSFFEIAPFSGRARVIGLARMNGIPCGVMANNPRFNGGSMDIPAGEKTMRLVELCDTFHLPLLYFADEPGFSVGPAQEAMGIVRAGARVVSVLSASRMPYASVVVRQLYGVAGGLHHRDGFYRRFAWPSTHGGSMHIEGGTAIAYKRDIENAADPESERERIEAKLQAISSPFRNAHAFDVEDIIDPRATRRLLVEFVEDAWKVLPDQLGPTVGLSYRP